MIKFESKYYRMLTSTVRYLYSPLETKILHAIRVSCVTDVLVPKHADVRNISLNGCVL